IFIFLFSCPQSAPKRLSHLKTLLGQKSLHEMTHVRKNSSNARQPLPHPKKLPSASKASNNSATEAKISTPPTQLTPDKS
ncbi:hypothetical protein, partial [Salmonella sp. s58408]|uniref:hypothetical protein n=1 Tax=Salmonella sp. s58408 TaxID=3159701 RepID=UPI00398073C1